jgi:hypothetical protein
MVGENKREDKREVEVEVEETLLKYKKKKGSNP